VIRQTTANTKKTKKTNYVVAPWENQLARLKRNGPKMAITKMVLEVDHNNNNKKKKKTVLQGDAYMYFLPLKQWGSP